MGMFNAPQKPQNEAPSELIPAGMHPALLYGIIDMGTHTDTFEGQTSNRHKIKLMWELDTDPKMSDGRPFAISKDYTITAGKWGPYIAKTSGLFALLKGWMGWDEKMIRLGNLGQCMGKPCLIQIGHKQGKKDTTKTYAEILNITPLMKGMVPPEPVNKQVVFELGKSLNEPGEGFDELPEWIQSRILSCLEFNGGVPPRIVDPKTTDETPF